MQWQNLVVDEWKRLPIGTEMTAREIIDHFTDGEGKVPAINALMKRRLKDYVVIVGPKNRKIYRKWDKESKSQMPIEEQFTATDLGESVLAVVDELKTTNQRMKQHLKQLIEEKTHLEKLYKTAQEKIIELNKFQGQRKFNLGDLQNYKNNLPKKED